MGECAPNRQSYQSALSHSDSCVVFQATTTAHQADSADETESMRDFPTNDADARGGADASPGRHVRHVLGQGAHRKAQGHQREGKRSGHRRGPDQMRRGDRGGEREATRGRSVRGLRRRLAHMSS